MFILDIETMGVESTSVVLSLAITHVARKDMTYAEMLDNSLFIKYSAKEQLAKNRTYDTDTCNWWDKQAEIVRDTSFTPKSTDMSFGVAHQIIRKWLADRKFDFNNDVIYTRGALDSLVLDSLYRTFETPMFVRYNKFLDVRTVIELLYPSSKNGYVDVPGFETSSVIKHHPVHDCAYDGMMMLNGANIE